MAADKQIVEAQMKQFEKTYNGFLSGTKVGIVLVIAALALLLVIYAI
jgi:Bacterial aa3 type cytochrome c oxidase subunit IV